MDWQALKRYYRLGAHCSGLEPKEKPSFDGVHHTTGNYFQTINHNPFLVDSPSNRICVWKKELVTMSECNFSFTFHLPHSTCTFIHQVKPVIEEVDSNDETHVATEDMAMEVYVGPPPSREYVYFLEKALLRTREALVEALHDKAHAERKAKRWKLFGDFLFQKFPETLMGIFTNDDSGDEFFRKLEANEAEEVAKQKGKKNKATKAEDAKVEGEIFLKSLNSYSFYCSSTIYVIYI